jgi:glycosyltransferase involved in cell wall biosynthesis
MDELHRVSPPDHVGFVLLGDRNDPVETDSSANVTCARYYDMDVLNRLDFEVAVFHHYSMAYLADDSFLRGRKLVYVIHSIPTTEPWSRIDPYGGNHDIARSFEKLCDAAHILVCVSEAERGKLLLLYPDLARKTEVIHNGFSAITDQPLSIRSERRTFGFLGRADYRKGLRGLVREFADIEGELRIGCGSEDEDYIRRTQCDIIKYGLASRIRWEGRVERRAKLSFLRSLDSLLVPSIWEPFGYVALEAIRAGVVPIISKQGGMAEIVGADYRYAFDPTRRGALMSCIATFQQDSNARVHAELERARKHAAALTAERMCEQYEALPRILSEHGTEAPRSFRRRYAGHGPMTAPRHVNASATPRFRAAACNVRSVHWLSCFGNMFPHDDG